MINIIFDEKEKDKESLLISKKYSNILMDLKTMQETKKIKKTKNGFF